MKKLLPIIAILACGIAAYLYFSGDKPEVTSQEVAESANSNTFKVGWSIYPGWMDNALMEMELVKSEDSFLKQRTDEAGVSVQIVKFKEYIPSVSALASGKLDACTMTLGEALSIPVDSGIPVTIILINDYSNGNDAICVPNGWNWENMKGKSILAEEFSVSQYLVWRALQKEGLPYDHVGFKNTPGDECSKVFLAGVESNSPVAVATWNPHVLRIEESGKADMLFTSADIPKEIIDCVVVRTDRIKGNEKAIQAYVNAHYDVMRYLNDPATKERAIRAMTVSAELRKEDSALFEGMLSKTAFYSTPQETAEFMDSEELKTQHDRIRQFLLDVGAFRSENADNHQITFDSSFVRNAQ